MIDASWIIVSKATGKPVTELFDFETVQFVNIERYRVYTVLEWLSKFNRQGDLFANSA